MAASHQIPTQLQVIENLAIEGNPNRTILIAERLLPAREIDNAETAMTQPDTQCEMKSFLIRTTMHERTRHPHDSGSIDRREPRRVDSADAAHRRSNLRGEARPKSPAIRSAVGSALRFEGGCNQLGDDVQCAAVQMLVLR